MRRSEGFVLIVVLWVVAILTVVTLGVGNRVLLDARASAYALDQSAALLQARGAVHRGIIEVRNKAYKDHLIQMTSAYAGLDQPWAQPVDLYEESGYFERPENGESDSAGFYIEDAERFIDINAGRTDSGEALLEQLNEEHGILPRDVRRRIRKRLTEGDWEDEGSIAFHAPEEIRYVRGVDEEDWFGEDGDPGLRDLVTTYGGGQININTAPREVLLCIPEMDDGAVDSILAYRNGADGEAYTADDQPFIDFGQLWEVTGITGDAQGALQQYCKLNSAFFIVTGTSTRRQGRVRALARAVVLVQGFSAEIIAWQETTFGS